jgi:hypothetical protein
MYEKVISEFLGRANDLPLCVVLTFHKDYPREWIWKQALEMSKEENPDPVLPLRWKIANIEFSQCVKKLQPNWLTRIDEITAEVENEEMSICYSQWLTDVCG